MERNSAQSTLFDAPADEAVGAALISVNQPKAALTKAQKTFNRLTAQIRRERESLAAWQGYESRFHERVGLELQPVLKQVAEAQRRMVRCIDQILSEKPAKGQRLNRKHRKVLCGMLADLCDELLQAGPDAELEALHDKHSEVSRDEMRQQDMELAEAMATDVFGADIVAGHDAKDFDDLMRHVHAKVGERVEVEARSREEAAAARRAKRGRPTKAEQAAERKAQAAQEASQSVREIYRKLASALHPDRETDPAERDRKTSLMQRANHAYERKDLLGLLGLQIELEHIDVDHLASVPDTRIGHYNEVLREQLEALEVEQLEFAERYHMVLGTLVPHFHPKAVDTALSARIKESRARLGHIEHDLTILADPGLRKTYLQELAEQRAEDDDPFDVLDFGLLDALVEDAAHGLGGQRSSRKKRKP